MEPTLREGSKLLVGQWAYLFKEPKVGDIVLFKYQGRYFIKRIRATSGEEIEVEGDNKSDSLKIDAIRKKDLIGKVIYPRLS